MLPHHRPAEIHKSIAALCISGVLALPLQLQAQTMGLGVSESNNLNLISYNIPALPMTEALILFGKQSGIQVTANSKTINDRRAPELKGSMTTTQALARLLSGSGLVYEINDSIISIKPGNPATADQTESQAGVVLSTVKVSASAIAPTYTSGNMDIPRSQDDAQPYVIITRETIANSGSTSVEDLLSQVLPMSTSQSNDTAGGWTGTSSQIDLRGLGASHTLILINGRRGAGVGSRGASEVTDQQNINNIPLAAIDRIEVLPTSASAIYGSNAIGGVINVVLKRDYIGSEINLRYGNTFDTDQGTTTANFVTGFALEDGRTQVLISGQKQQANALLTKDRPFAEEGRELILQNNPESIYGMSGKTAISPIYGNLVNIRSVNGSPLFPNINNSSITHIPLGYAGWREDGVQPLIDNLGSYSLGLSNGIGGFSGVANLVGESESESLDLSLNRYFTDRLSVFFDAGIDESEVASAGNYHGYGVVTVPAKAPNNPFGQAVYVAYPANYSDGISQQQRMATTKTKRTSIGANWEITPDWTINTDYTYSNARNDLSYQRRPTRGTNAYNAALANGTLDVLRDVTTYTTDLSTYWAVAPNFTDQTLNDSSIRAAGKLFSWYAGDVKLATGVEHRTIESDSRSETQIINNPDTPVTQRKQSTKALYAELTLPVVSPEMQLTALHKVDVQIAARHERFDLNTIGTQYSATSPTVGFSLAPNKQLMLRASYSEGFISPTVSQLTPPVLGTALTTVTDPLRGNEQTQFYALAGGNPELEPETAESRNLGLVFTPKFIDNLRMSVDYYQIKKENNITSLSAQALVSDPLYSARVTRAPVEVGDQYAVGKITEVYTGSFNALWLDTRGVDTNITYALDTGIGHLTFNLGYTYVDRYLQQGAVGAAPLSYVANNLSSDSSTPLRHRLNASMQLKLSPQFNLGWAMQHYGSYHLTDTQTIISQGADTIASQTFHDIFVQYSIETAASNLNRVQLTAGIKNMFNEYAVDVSTSDYLSRYSDARLRQYYINLKTTF